VLVPTTREVTLEQALCRVREAFFIRQRAGGHEVIEADFCAGEPEGLLSEADAESEPGRVLGFLPRVRLECLGDVSFCADHGLRYPYMTGAMANGIGSVDLVEAIGCGAMLGIFGAAGLAPTAVEAAVDRLSRTLGPAGLSFGFNLIHSPVEPGIEAAVADLYLRRSVRLVEASAYLDLTLPLVKYRVSGLECDDSGQVVATNRVIAKVSRVEVATKFLSPAPAKFLRELVATGAISAQQAEWAGQVPMADDVTAEADSGGHTDNQPAIVLLPTMIALRDRVQVEYRYEKMPRIGAAGGISTPWSAASAFGMGAAYVVTGSVNQGCVESGTSDGVRRMLAAAQQADVAMAPAADMFEMGVKVQVLKRGTMFAMRAAKLFELYRTCGSLESLPAADRTTLEKNIFRMPLGAVWEETREYFRQRDPAQIDRAIRDPKHKLALVFRWYLGNASTWANTGEPSRAIDYQIWCGPAMSAFNEWVKGTFLERPENRRVVTVAMNILYGAAVLARARCLASQGVLIPPGMPRLAPLELGEIEERLAAG
jgi:PfaD family protein